jgi:hypothetical protein
MDQKIVDRFWAKVDKRTHDKCWKWLGSIDSCGYGRINVYRKLAGAHRISYEIANGPIGTACAFCINATIPLV